MCDEITYLFQNFSAAAAEVWEWMNNFIPLYYACDNFLASKLICFSERSPRSAYLKQL